MRKATVFIAWLALTLAIGLLTAWMALALWYRLPLPVAGRWVALALTVALGVGVLVAFRSRWRWRALGIFLIALVSVMGWWATIRPPANGDWATDVSRQVTGQVDGNTLILANVRNFEWRTRTDFNEQWENRSYDLNHLRSLDMFLSYWAGPEMAHVLFSFGFDDGRYLAWSAEVRRTRDGQFSPVADFFKSSPLVIIAADERDIVRLRTNVRSEDVRLYRLSTSPAEARRLLLEYVADANDLAKTPEFYNSITTNCTTTIVRLMRAAGGSIPFDWRLIVNGYLPGYAFDMGALDKRLSLEQIIERGKINQKAQDADTSPEFSRLIRDGVPSPNDGKK